MPSRFRLCVELVDDRLAAEIAVHRLAVLVEEVVALVGVPDEPALGGQHHLVAPSGDRLADDLLRAPHAIGRRGVDQRDARVDRGADRGDRRRFVGAAPHPAADGPGAEADRRRRSMPERADLAGVHRHAHVWSFAHHFEHAVGGRLVEHHRLDDAARGARRRSARPCSAPAATPMVTGIASSSVGLERDQAGVELVVADRCRRDRSDAPGVRRRTGASRSPARSPREVGCRS